MAQKRTPDIATQADDTQPPKRKIGELRRLGRFLNPYRIYVVGALLALTVAAGTVLTIGQGVRRLVDEGFTGGNIDLLNEALMALLVVVLVLAAAPHEPAGLGRRAAREAGAAWAGHRMGEGGDRGRIPVQRPVEVPCVQDTRAVPRRAW